MAKLKKKSSTECSVCGNVPILPELFYPEVGYYSEEGDCLHKAAFLDARCCSTACVLEFVSERVSTSELAAEVFEIIVMPREAPIEP